jgi:serine/threonine protein kinase
MERAPEEHPPRLPSGTVVGQWRVVAWQDQGAFGTVYRALRIGQEQEGPAALKLAHSPGDARFAREAQLLSRLSHPSIPRLLDQGVLRHASGAEQPFFVMEWVEGTPLYTWADQHSPGSQQVFQLLAQLARALATTHAAHAVHRDVKGDNIRVRLSDGRAVLLDFGSGHFRGASRLTWKSLPPVTPEYLSAQAWLFNLRLAHAPDSYYPPTAADDLHALGVTAYRLVMGEYPPAMDARQDEHGSWQVTSPDPRPQLENNPRVEPRLR